MPVSSADVVAAARAWLGTPYHPCADIRGVGVDCGMLIVRVYVDLGLCAPFDPRPYAPDWHIHRDEERYLGFLLARCIEVQAPEPGDIVALRYGRCWSHAGIVSLATPLTIIHAYAPARCVLEDEIARDPALAAPARAMRIFRPKGLA
jgi:cell wall-associated NlpC family hydrolase